jgi:hypothetical protein
VARGVDQVELVLDALVDVAHPHGLGLDRDPALALDVHTIEVLLGLVARGEQAGRLHEAIGEGALAVVDVGDDAEASDRAHWRRLSPGFIRLVHAF